MNKTNLSTQFYQTFSRVLILVTFLLSTSIYQAQNEILNSGFELGTDSLPENWSLDNFGSGRTTDYAAAGNYSMSVWNWYYYVSGFCVNGNVNGLIATSQIKKQAGTPFIYKPAFIEGYYHYDTTGTFSDNDSAVVEVLLKKYNSSTQTIDSIAYGEVHLPATDLTQNLVQFYVPITDLMPGINPDSIIVVLKSSINGYCETSLSGNCLYFYVDELSAGFPLGNKTPLFNEEKLDFWPNPMTDILNINIKEDGIATIEIFNMNGQVIKSQIIKNNQTINVEELQPGAYLLCIKQNGKKEFHKLIK